MPVALLGLLLMAGSGALLIRSIRKFQAAWREAAILRLPVAPEQAFSLNAAGDVRLFLEGPRYRTWMKRFSFELSEAATGRRIAVTPKLSGSGVRGRTRSRVERGQFLLPAPTELILRIGGLEPGDLSQYEIVFMRPISDRLLAFILGCVFLGIVLIGSLVLLILGFVLT
jgi:hypothetical protein